MSRNRAAAVAGAMVLYVDLSALALLPVWIAVVVAISLTVLILIGMVVVPRWVAARHPLPDPVWSHTVVRDPLIGPGRHRKPETLTIIERHSAPAQGMINTAPMGSR